MLLIIVIYSTTFHRFVLFIIIWNCFVFDHYAGGENRSQLPPFRVCSLRTSPGEAELQVLLLDPEALIMILLSEEARYIAMAEAPNNPKRQAGSSATSGGTRSNPSTRPTNSKIYEVAQLLLSCLHSWGLDPNLDELCTSKLGRFLLTKISRIKIFCMIQ